MNIRIIALIALAAVVFGIPAGAEINETPCINSSGGNATDPPVWIDLPIEVTPITVVINYSIIEEPPSTLTAAIVRCKKVEIRGEVVDAATQIAPFIWTGQNFAGLYYDADRNLMSDSLTSTVTVPDTIESGDLEYTAYRVESCYTNPEIGEYFAIGWFGERYMAVNGKPYLISRIIFEMGKGCKKTLATGDEWDLGGGYSLVVTRIDLDANEVWLSLFKNGAEVASSVIRPRETGDWFGNCMHINGFPGAYDVEMWNAPTTSTFVYQEDAGAGADVPIFSVYVDAIFRGTVTNIAQFKYAMLIDDDPVSVIDTGAGMMKAETVTSESVRLVNRKSIDLHRNSDIMIAEDLLIHVADDRDGNGVANYRYYPYVNRACPDPEPTTAPTPTPAPRPADGPGVVRIRGEVVEPADLQTGDIMWNASNFAAFWHDPDGDLMTETMRIAAGALSGYDRTIEDRIEFDCSEWGAYNVTSFMAETYFSGYSADTSGKITGEPISLVSKGMLSKVLIDEDNKHIISTGASLELREGYELQIVQLDAGGGLKIELLRNGISVYTDAVKVPATYVYTRDLGKVDDVPLIVIHVDSVFASIETDMFTIKGLFQISEDYICDRTIEERQIEYVTETMEVDFDYSGWGEYDAMSFMAETYFAGCGDNTAKDITGDTISLVSNDMLSKVLIDEDYKHCIPTGASLELREGYELKLIQLDIQGDKAQIELLRNGKSVDTGIIGCTPSTYVYARDLGKVDDVPLIVIHVDSVIACIELDMIVIDGIFQISEDYISLKPGDTYGEMELVSTSCDAIRMENYDAIDLSEGETIDLMGDIKLIVADNETLRFAPVAELTDPGTYEVRGAVYSPNVSRSDTIVWNASNFAAFWYEIDSDVATETLEIAPGTLSGLDRTINENDLVYATQSVYMEYGLYESEELTVDGHEGYLSGGWVGRQHVAINGRIDKLCELLVEFEDTDKKTLATGEPWDLGRGFTLTARQISLEGDKVWFSLYKDDKELDSKVIVCGSGDDPRDHVYTYTADIGGEDDVPVFSCYVTAVFRGMESNLVQVTYVFLIDDDMVRLGTGDRFGCMEVVAVSSDKVILKNDDAIDLGSGTTKQIMEDMYFKTADDTVIRFYPFVKRTIGGAVPLESGDYIFDSELNINEGIVIENRISIDVVGVGTDMDDYAKFRISSYQKPTRTVMMYQGDGPAKYDTQFGDSIYIDVTGFCRGDSVRFRVTGPKNWRVTEYYVVEPAEESSSDTDGAIDLSRDADVEIMKDMYFKVADNDTARLYPYKVVTIEDIIPTPPETIPAADADNDGVPDVWDRDNSTSPGYWVNSEGIGRRWGDMNGDGKLTSADALTLLQAAAGKIGL